MLSHYNRLNKNFRLIWARGWYVECVCNSVLNFGRDGLVLDFPFAKILRNPRFFAIICDCFHAVLMTVQGFFSFAFGPFQHFNTPRFFEDFFGIFLYLARFYGIASGINAELHIIYLELMDRLLTVQHLHKYCGRL